MNRRVVVLGDIAEITRGLSYSSKYFDDSGRPLVGLGQFAPSGGIRLDNLRMYKGEFRPKHLAKPGDLLIAMTDLTQTGQVLGCPLRLPGSFAEESLFTLDVGRVSLTSEEILPEFLYYVLRAREFNQFAFGLATGTTVRRVRPTDVLQYEFELPPLPEQRAIAEVLGSLDDKIELSERMNATLDEMARALFKSWFVDFDPVRAKAEGRQPSHMDTATAALFPASFEDSPLGPIPAGWRVEDMESVARVVPGRSYKSAELADSDVALVTLKSIARGGGYQPRGLKPYTGPFKDEQKLRPGDVVVAKTDLTQNADVIGRVARVPHEPGFGTLVASLDLAVVRAIDAAVPQAFLHESLRTQRFIDHALGFTNGTTVLHLGKDAIPTYPLLVPDERATASFAERLEPMTSLAHTSAYESATLTELRDTLLPKLISGELRVREAERAVEAAV